MSVAERPCNDAEWQAIAEAFIRFIHSERSWWLNGGEACGFGEYVAFEDVSAYPGEQCEICSGHFGAEIAVAHTLKIKHPKQGCDVVCHYAHIECLRNLLSSGPPASTRPGCP